LIKILNRKLRQGRKEGGNPRGRVASEPFGLGVFVDVKVNLEFIFANLILLEGQANIPIQSKVVSTNIKGVTLK